MAIKFCSNTIATAKAVPFKELVARFAANKGLIKEAAKKDDNKKDDKEGKDSGQPAWEGKQENNNKPEVKEEKDCKATATPEIVKAAKEDKKEDKKDSKKDGTVSSGQLDVEPLHQKGESVDAGNKDLTGDGKKTEAFGTNGRFVKISKLNDKTKKWYRSYLSNLFPADYVEALLAD